MIINSRISGSTNITKIAAMEIYKGIAVRLPIYGNNKNMGEYKEKPFSICKDLTGKLYFQFGKTGYYYFFGTSFNPDAKNLHLENRRFEFHLIKKV